ncbi:MAG: TatD family hydrolase [Bacteroidales bacterium]|nr:TatD family hydrolase [Bacteroidales bacterium]
MPEIIDTHTHFYGAEFAPDFSEAIRLSREAGVSRALIPAVNAGSLAGMDEACALAPDFFLRMIGQHPTEMPVDYEADLDLLEKELFGHPEKYVAVGEIGLDYYWSTERKAEMNAAFRRQLEWAKARSLPVSIHARSATLDAVRAVREVGAGSLTGVFHSFTDGEEELRAVLDLPGFVIGVNGVFTFKKSPLPELFRRLLPIDRLVLETDAPYLSPTPFRGKRNAPFRLPLVLSAVAEVYGLSEEDAASQILATTRRVFPLV